MNKRLEYCHIPISSHLWWQCVLGMWCCSACLHMLGLAWLCLMGVIFNCALMLPIFICMYIWKDRYEDKGIHSGNKNLLISMKKQTKYSVSFRRRILCNSVSAYIIYNQLNVRWYILFNWWKYLNYKPQPSSLNWICMDRILLISDGICLHIPLYVILWMVKGNEKTKKYLFSSSIIIPLF